MKLLDSLFEQGLYVENLDDVLRIIVKHPDLIYDLAEIVQKYLEEYKSAVHMLYVDDEDLVYSIGFRTEDELKEASSILYVKPKSKHFVIEIYAEECGDE